jgi:Ca-activated chloride channel family protein
MFQRAGEMKIGGLLVCGTVTIAFCLSYAAECAELTNRVADFRAESQLVVIPLSVTDRAGQSVPGLSKTDFDVTEDGVAQPIWAISRWDAPASIGVIVDTSGSMGNTLRRAQSALSALFHETDPEDEAFLIRFASSPILETGFVHDPEQISARLLWAAPRGATALFDAVFAGLDQMKRATNLHKALVVVTDGGDNHSRRTYGELLSAARESDAQVFVVAVRRHANDVDERRGRAQLDQLANDTGGRMLIVDSDSSVKSAIATINELIRTQYLLSYRPLNASHDGKWHLVRVRLCPRAKESLYRVRSKSGYHAADR